MSTEGRAFAERLTVARLASVGADGRPHCVPVCFALDGERALVMTDPASRKARNVRATGVAALAVDDGRSVRGVTLDGPARVIDDPEGFLAAQEIMLRTGAVARRREPGEQVVIEIESRTWFEWGFGGAS